MAADPRDGGGLWGPAEGAESFWAPYTGSGIPDPAPDGKLFNYGVQESGPNHFDLDEIDGIIDQHGHPCSYRPAVRCPCARPETRDASGSCALCRPLGWVYPRERWVQTRILLSSRRQSVEYAPLGLYEQGTAQVTLPRALVPGLMDMVVLEGVPHTVHEVRVRPRQDIELDQVRARLRDDRVALPALRPVEDRLLYPDLLELEVLSWTDRAGELVLGRSGHDYVLREGGEIAWLPGRGPAAGDTYTVRYLAQAAYVFPASSTPRAEAGVRLPYRVDAIRLDDAGRVLAQQGHLGASP